MLDADVDAESSSPAARSACRDGWDRRRLRLALLDDAGEAPLTELPRLRCFMLLLLAEEEDDVRARRGREGSTGLLGERMEAEAGEARAGTELML